MPSGAGAVRRGYGPGAGTVLARVPIPESGRAAHSGVRGAGPTLVSGRAAHSGVPDTNGGGGNAEERPLWPG